MILCDNYVCNVGNYLIFLLDLMQEYHHRPYPQMYRQKNDYHQIALKVRLHLYYLYFIDVEYVIFKHSHDYFLHDICKITLICLAIEKYDLKLITW